MSVFDFPGLVHFFMITTAFSKKPPKALYTNCVYGLVNTQNLHQFNKIKFRN